MTNTVKEKWDRVYRSQKNDKVNPASVLTENYYLLPDSGRVLDLACGQGANALFLARQGLFTEAWDISSVGIKKLQKNTEVFGLNVYPQERDINAKSLVGLCFDVIVVSRFLDRTLCDAIIGALNKGGLLYYQTYTSEKTIKQGPSNPDYLLNSNELLTLFSTLRLVFYRENSVIGDCSEGVRNEAQFIGQKL